MDEKFWKEVGAEAKAARDPGLLVRLAAVRDVLKVGMGADDVAEMVDVCPNTVRNWMRRFEADKLDGLRDLPCLGRPGKIPAGKIARFTRLLRCLSRITPAEARALLHEKTGKWLHVTNIRKIMRRADMTRKVPTAVHVNRATRRAVRRWQGRIRRRISRLKGLGYAVVVQDESVFTHDAQMRAKYWSREEVPIHVPYTGSHRRIVAYGAISDNDERFVRTHPKFNAGTFVSYLAELRKRFGKVAVIADRVPQHTARVVRRFFHDNRDVRLEYLPTGTPQPGAVEALWNVAEGAGGVGAPPHVRGIQGGRVRVLQGCAALPGHTQLSLQGRGRDAQKLLIGTIG